MGILDTGSLPPGPHRPLVLLYHRVANLETDPWGLAVRPPDFERQVRFLSAAFDIVPLASLIPEQSFALPKPGTVAITFDDGYGDNFETAWPVLERYEAPATFFICSSGLESSEEFWWDRLERVLLFPGRLPADVSIGTGESAISVKISEVDYSEADFLRHRAWRAGSPPPTSRHRAFIALWMHLRSMPTVERHRALDKLCSLCAAPARPTHRAMTVAQLRQMSASDLVEVGAHTVTHGRLAAASEDEQRHEIEASKQAIEDVCGKPVSSFAYPFGSAADFTATTSGLVAAAGFHRACTTRTGTIADGCERFAVPRCFVEPGGVSVLVRQLRTWLSSPAD